MGISFKGFYYSDKYDDGTYEYRHVIVPEELQKRLPRNRFVLYFAIAD